MDFIVGVHILWWPPAVVGVADKFNALCLQFAFFQFLASTIFHCQLKPIFSLPFVFFRLQTIVFFSLISSSAINWIWLPDWFFRRFFYISRCRCSKTEDIFSLGRKKVFFWAIFFSQTTTTSVVVVVAAAANSNSNKKNQKFQVGTFTAFRYFVTDNFVVFQNSQKIFSFTKWRRRGKIIKVNTIQL